MNSVNDFLLEITREITSLLINSQTIEELSRNLNQGINKIAGNSCRIFLKPSGGKISEFSSDNSQDLHTCFSELSAQSCKYLKFNKKSVFQYGFKLDEASGYDAFFLSGAKESEPDEFKLNIISIAADIFSITAQKINAQLSATVSGSGVNYRQLVEGSSDVIYICDYKGDFKYINHQVTNITGFDIEEIKGRNFLQFIVPEYQKSARDFYKHQFDHLIENTYYEYPVNTKDGRVVWFGQNVNLIVNEGKVTELHAVARDITERKKAEKMLTESEAKFYTLSKNGHAAIFICDSYGRVIYVNEKYCGLTGLSQQEAIGFSHISSIHPDEKNKVLETWSTVLSEGKQKDLEFRMVNKSGKVAWVYGQAGPLKEGGIVTGFVGTLIDISERKKAEKMADDIHQKMEAVFNHSDDAFFLIDPVSKEILECNDRAAELFEYSGKSLMIGKCGKDVRKHEMTWEEKEAVKNGIAKNRIFRSEVLYKTAKGNEFWGSFVIKPVEIGGQNFEFIRVSDISRTKLIEQELINAKLSAESAMKAREQFLSVVSHEIRTPMNAIMGMTDWLIQDKPRSSQLEFLQGIKYSSDNLLKLINDILDFSKIEAGKVTFEEIEFSIGTVLNNVYKTFRLKAEEKKIDFAVCQEEGLPDTLIGDPVKLTQILMNLTGNAIKFTEKGKVTIRAGGKSNKNEFNLRLVVEDSGIGIPAAQIEHIFDSFTQANNDTTRKYGGSGLGLTICRRLVELQNGRLSVKSTPGAGSVFTAEIPFRVAERYDYVISKEPDYNLFSDLKVLLVEDNLMNQLLTTTFLKKWNVDVKVANNGNEAIDLIDTDEFDIIFMDLHMPGMDGFETTKFIRNVPRFSDLPIIALTASVLLDVREKVIGSGMNDFITKPFKPYELNAKLSMHLPQKISGKIKA
jgi:PAS domain S-box-containing protein